MPEQLTAVSLFAGVGGFDIALERAGVEVVAAVEIDKDCRRVLARRFPSTRVFADVKEVTGEQLVSVGFRPRGGILVGGFPCQDLSVAGKRAGLAGERSGLFFEITRLAAELEPEWLLLENVPGLLSSHDGRDFGAVLGSLAELGYGLAYRILDAQFFGVPQRRRRVFIVGRLGDDGRTPSEVLALGEGLLRDPSARHAEGQEVAGTLGGGTPGGGPKLDTDRVTFVPFTERVGTLLGNGDAGPDVKEALAGQVVPAVTAKWAKGTGGPSGDEAQNLVTHTLCSEGEDGTGRGTPLTTFVKSHRAATTTDAETWRPDTVAPTVNLFDAGDTRATTIIVQEPAPPQLPGFGAEEPTSPDGSESPPVAFAWQNGGGYGEAHDGLAITEDGTGPISRKNQPAVAGRGVVPIEESGATRGDGSGVGLLGVRRLTPLECERLQGFPTVLTWTGMTRDEMIAAALAFGLLSVDTVSGRVFRHRGPGGARLSEREEVVGSDVNGYLVGRLVLNGVRKQVRLHRVVWIAAHGVPDGGQVVAHRNNIKTDNRLDNLYLTTPEQNSADAARDGLYVPRRKVDPGTYRLICDDYAHGDMTMRELAERYGLSKSRIHQIVREAPWTEGQSDSVRYRQMGNAVAVPCAEWIAHRLVAVAEREESHEHNAVLAD